MRETPEPPNLVNRGVPAGFDDTEIDAGTADFRRAELDAALREGAWREGFAEWATYADLTDDEFRTIERADLFDAFDFFWDGDDRRLRFEAPRLAVGDGRSTVDAGIRTRLNAELQELGGVVLGMLSAEYVDWAAEAAPDYLWREETLGRGHGEETFDPEVEDELFGRDGDLEAATNAE